MNCCMEHEKFGFPIVRFQIQIKFFLKLFAHLSKPVHKLQSNTSSKSKISKKENTHELVSLHVKSAPVMTFKSEYKRFYSKPGRYHMFIRDF
jgi:hypothetical protein